MIRVITTPPVSEKRAILHRKNSLFYKTIHGAYIGDLFMSLIHTCKMSKINFGVGMKYNDAVEFDHWLRRRIRMCYWKQWRRARRRIGELIQLGSPRYQAILTGLS